MRYVKLNNDGMVLVEKSASKKPSDEYGIVGEDITDEELNDKRQRAYHQTLKENHKLKEDLDKKYEKTLSIEKKPYEMTADEYIAYKKSEAEKAGEFEYKRAKTAEEEFLAKERVQIGEFLEKRRAKADIMKKNAEKNQLLYSPLNPATVYSAFHAINSASDEQRKQASIEAVKLCDRKIAQINRDTTLSDAEKKKAIKQMEQVKKSIKATEA